MKSIRTSAAISVLFLNLSVTNLLPAQDEKSEVGRYQIVSGTIEAITQEGKKMSSERIPVVIKIDTKTGDTWILVTMLGPESDGQGWQGLGLYREYKRKP